MGAEGVQTFLVKMDEQSAEAQAIFKEAGFRFCARLHLWQVDRPLQQAFLNQVQAFNSLRELTSCDRQEYITLYNDSLPLEIRNTLSKNVSDFTINPLTFVKQCLSGLCCDAPLHRYWVMEDPARDVLIAGAEIRADKPYEPGSVFKLTLTLSPGWQLQALPVLAAVIQKIHTINAHPLIHFQVYEFEKDLQATLPQFGWTSPHSYLILSKDYWTRIDKPFGLHHAFPILPGQTSPA
jgi:hypothetical protein